MTKSNYWLSCILLLFLPFLYSCEQYHYAEEKMIEDERWTYNNPLSFEFEIKDTSLIYNVLLDVKHHRDYPNQNIYAKLLIHLPSGDTLKPKAVSIELASKAGEWLGICNGEYCTRRLSFLPNATFAEVGQYKVDFQQYTRKDSLSGIHSLKLLIEKTEQEREGESEEKQES